MGPTAAVFLKTEASTDVLDQLDDELRSIATRIEPTRKGRDWRIWIKADGGPGDRPFDVHVWDTHDRLWDCQEDLEELGLEPSEVPVYIAISAGGSERVDWNVMERLLASIALRFGGVATNPEK